MAIDLSRFFDNDVLEYLESALGPRVLSGPIDNVDTKEQTITVELLPRPGEQSLARVIPINNLVTPYGAGLRVIPISGSAHALVLEDPSGSYYHLGYDLTSIGLNTEDQASSTESFSQSLGIRHLAEGDVQLSGSFGSEVYLPFEGSVHIRSSAGSSLILDNTFNRLEGSFANLKFELDGVRFRLGNIIRQTKKDLYDDQFIVETSDGKIKGLDQLEESDVGDELGEEGTFKQIREFTVQVGTIPDFDKCYRDIVKENFNEDISPAVGLFSISDVYVREDGRPLMSGTNPVQCILKTGSGGGFFITSDGKMSVFDGASWSPTVLSGGDSKGIRTDKSFIEISTIDDEGAEFKTEIRLFHESNAGIDIREGYVLIREATGRTVKLDGYGLTVNIPEACATIISKDIALIPEGGSVCIGMNPTDGALKATHAATLFDTHTHMGPCGPPMPSFHWSPLLNVPGSPLVVQGLRVQ